MKKNNKNQKDTDNQCRSVPPPHLSSHQQVKEEFAFFLTNLSQGVFVKNNNAREETAVAADMSRILIRG